MTTDTAAHGIVSGRVQGVAFRWSTAREAARLELVGWVRNLPNGSVEVWVQGHAGAIAEMREFLEMGPPGARVDSLAVQAVEPDPELSWFEIR